MNGQEWLDTRRWPAIHPLILGLLDQHLPDGPYRRHLRQTIEHCTDLGDGSPTISALPFLTCAASGGNLHQAVPIVAAWQLTRLAAKLFDDVEDDEAGNRSAQANTATGILFLIQLALGELTGQGVQPEGALRIRETLNGALLRACAGQHTDLTSGGAIGAADLCAWFDATSAKSGELFGWAAWAGAFVANTDDGTLSCFSEYGQRLGLLIQVADDFNDVWRPDGVSDLLAGRLNLPVCYALSVAEGSDHDRLNAQLRAAAEGDRTAETEAREALIQAGAQAFLVVFARIQHRQATAALRRLNPGIQARCQLLIALLDRVFPAVNGPNPGD